MNDLAERLLAMTGPNRQLDAELAVAIRGFFILEPAQPGQPVAYGYEDIDGNRITPSGDPLQLVPRFTASHDAVRSLIPYGWYIQHLGSARSKTNISAWCAQLAHIESGREYRDLTFISRVGNTEIGTLAATALIAHGGDL